MRGKTTALFITTTTPHKQASRDSISRWFKIAMERSGLDLSIFTAHSVRAASTSTASKAKVPLHTILNTAGWSKQTTFSKFYNKPLADSGKFAKAIFKTAK